MLRYQQEPRCKTQAGTQVELGEGQARGWAHVLAGVLILEQRLGLLLTDDGGLHLRGVHVHVQLPAHQQAHSGCKLGLRLQDLRGLLLNDECAAGTQVTRCCLSGQGSGPSVRGGCLPWGSRANKEHLAGTLFQADH